MNRFVSKFIGSQTSIDLRVTRKTDPSKLERVNHDVRSKALGNQWLTKLISVP
jgi:hypothetical protein